MAEIAASITTRAIATIGQNTGSGGLREWINKGTYNASAHQQNGVVLGNVYPSELLQYLSFDYSRFALASWESFYSANLESDELKLVSWPLLKMYYSAFFAAHAIMRSSGVSVVKIERKQIDLINQLVGGGNPPASPGMYEARVQEVRPGQLEVTLVPHADGGGVHDGFWKAFAAFLERSAADAVQKQASDADQFLAGVSELTPRLKGWLSARRNEINYQQLYGVWYPVTRAKSVSDFMGNIRFVESKTVRLSRSLSDEIRSFLETSQFLACLNGEVAQYVAARSPSGRGFGAKWTKFNSLHRKFAV